MAGNELNRNDLYLFLVAVDAGSFAAAGRALGVEHSTISRRIDALEGALGGALVLRTHRGLELTEMGLRVAGAARRVEQAVADVWVAAGFAERVRLAAPSGFARLLSDHLDRLHTVEPPIALEIVSGADTVDLSAGEADLALRAGPVADLDLVGRRVATVGWSLYATADYLDRHPSNDDPTDLAGHAVIGFDAGLAASPVGQWLLTHSQDANVVLRSHDMADAVAAAQSGAGIALVPCFLADGAPPLVRVTPEVVATRDLWIVARREVRMARAVRHVRDVVIAVLRRHDEQLRGRVRPS